MNHHHWPSVDLDVVKTTPLKPLSHSGSMNRLALSLRRSCVAFVVQTFGGTTACAFTPTSSHNLTPKGPFRLASSSTGTTKNNFEPPEPPGTHGTPVFPDIDLTTTTTTAAAQTRNLDPNAVFVVTGASRGLGREFVKQLLTRTEVRSGELRLIGYRTWLLEPSYRFLRERLWRVAAHRRIVRN